jgi:hypothetical protein
MEPRSSTPASAIADVPGIHRHRAPCWPGMNVRNRLGSPDELSPLVSGVMHP